MPQIVYNKITTIFLDVGNTLISVDFELVAHELRKLDIHCDAGTLFRAEAAARPVISPQVPKLAKNTEIDMRAFYLANILMNVPDEDIKGLDDAEHVAGKLVTPLFPEGNAKRLWSHVLPNVEEALGWFADAGYKMHVISNADGTVDEQLRISGLRKYFGEVIDSHVVNIEKPAPKIFLLALEQASCTAEEALYVGDIYDVDVLGARNVGMQAVLLDPFNDWKNVDCERVPDLLSLARKFKEHEQNSNR